MNELTSKFFLGGASGPDVFLLYCTYFNNGHILLILITLLFVYDRLRHPRYVQTVKLLWFITLRGPTPLQGGPWPNLSWFPKTSPYSFLYMFNDIRRTRFVQFIGKSVPEGHRPDKPSISYLQSKLCYQPELFQELSGALDTCLLGLPELVSTCPSFWLIHNFSYLFRHETSTCWPPSWTSISLGPTTAV